MFKSMFKQYPKALIDAFYNPRQYRQALLFWPGVGIRYLVWLSLLLAVIQTGSFLVNISYFEQKQLPIVLDQVPTMKLEDGIISVDAKQPIFITNADNPLKITIDTTKSESELRDTKTNIGIGKDYVFVQTDTDYRVMYTKKIRDKHYLIDKKTLADLWQQNIPFIKAVVFPVLWLGQFINVIAKSVIIAVLSYAVTAFMREEYVFATRMRLAALALTAPEIISTVLSITLRHQTAPWFVFLLACLYIYVMIVLMRKLPVAEPLAN